MGTSTAGSFKDKTERREVDWEAVRKIYRSGMYSNVEIAKHVGLTEGAIRKRAARCAWKRDLVDDVARRRERKLLADAVRELEEKGLAGEYHAAAQDLRLNREREASESQESGDIVEQASAVSAAIVNVHRKQVQQGRSLCEMLLQQLREVAANREEIEAAIMEETDPDVQSSNKAQRAEGLQRRAMMLRAVSLPANAQTMRDLAHAYKTLVSVEREAYGLDKGDPETSKAPLVLFDIRF